MSLKDNLIKRLETRMDQLTGKIDLGYEVQKKHHLRDVLTVISYLKNYPDAEKLINNLPIPPTVEKGHQLTMEESIYICPRCGAQEWNVDKDSLSNGEKSTVLECTKCGFEMFA